MEEKNELNDGSMAMEDEDMDFGANPRILVDKAEVEVQALHHKQKRGRLNVQPDFQRHFVWQTAMSVRLIESALLRVPLPAIYLLQEQDDTLSVIDGQQRLTSFFNFIDGTFKLYGLRIRKDLNGKYFKDLSDEDQEKISECSLRQVIFLKDSDPALKFEIFHRVNSGSVSLNDQEMRNCVFHGRYNKLLRELAANKDYWRVMGMEKPHYRMTDIAYVLRFAAFYFQTDRNYRAPMRNFMNEEMHSRRNISIQDEEELEGAFKTAVNLVYTVLGENAFRRWSIATTIQTTHRTHRPQQFSASLFDVLMGIFAKADRNMVTRNADSIREALIHLTTSNEDFIEAITRATSDQKQVKRRFNIWHETFDKIVQHDRRQPRCFSRVLKQELFRQNSTCALCGQQIADIDDAAVDHIEQYWLGGKTISENARLVHRYCNNARSKRG